jgi:DNA-binding NtrC family response regulator
VLGVGTTVRLVLPAAPADAAEPAERREGVDDVSGRSVLLVEDNDDVAESLEQVLRSIGCEVERVDRAAAALAWLHARPRRADVLLTDVVMPGEMDGAALAEHVRGAFPELKIVVMTGYAKQAEAIAARGFEIIPKPCSPALLAATIARRQRGSTPD